MGSRTCAGQLRFVSCCSSHGRFIGGLFRRWRERYLYRSDRMSVVEGSVERIGEHDPAFGDSRTSLAARFAFRGKSAAGDEQPLRFEARLKRRDAGSISTTGAARRRSRRLPGAVTWT
jgi:hypothetical protein